MLAKALLAAVLVALLSACTSMRLERARAAALNEIDVDTCIAEGGQVKGVCMFGTPACVKAFSDAGKPCSDSSECDGMCWVQENTNTWERAEPVAGVCQDTTDTCGCWEEVIGGRLSGNGGCFD
jgi:hypothetical protein